MQVVTRPWCERPPLGYPLPLYARAVGSGGRRDERRRPRRACGRRATAPRAVAPGIHSSDSSRELVLRAPMPPSSWIRFPRFFSDVMSPRGPLELWLQHADCNAPATGAEIEAVPTGKIFMTRGWGEVARVCHAEGALAIHFEYDGASTLFFKMIITCDRGRRRLASFRYKWGGGRSPRRPSLLGSLASSSLLHC